MPAKKKAPAKKKTQKKKSSKKKTILVVDDEADIRSTVKTVLTKEGYKVVTANNADQALTKSKKQKFNLILLDIMMPGTPVREVIPKIKGKVVFCSVVKTTEAEKEDLFKSSKVKGFIQKPFDIEELVKKVKKYSG